MKPKHIGGLGVGCLSSLNLALLAEWWWSLKVDHNSLWSWCIISIHNLKGIDGEKMAKKFWERCTRFPKLVLTWKIGVYLLWISFIGNWAIVEAHSSGKTVGCVLVVSRIFSQSFMIVIWRKLQSGE